MTMFGYCKSAPDIPIEHLDYKYIETCKDANVLQKILQVLRSGEEGCYPALEEFTEKKLLHQKPDSALLEKSNKEKMIIELAVEEREQIANNIQDLQFHATNGFSENDLPPIRSSKQIGLQEQKPEQKTSKKRVIPRSYDEWSELDKEIEKNGESVSQSTSKTVINDANPPAHKLLSKENIIHSDGKSSEELSHSAQIEKRKGNEAFYSSDYDEALIYYNRSLNLLKSAAVYNNRAMANIKLKNYPAALGDCNNVIQMEPNNIKAYLRRGIANQSLQKLEAALDDFAKVLELEPLNKRGKQLLEEVRSELEKKSTCKKKGKRLTVEEINGDIRKSDNTMVEEESKNIKQDSVQRKGKRLNIEDVDTSKSQIETGSKENKPVLQVTECVTEILLQNNTEKSVVVRNKELPADVVMLKNEGNESYKSGQYVNAMKSYTSAIHVLMEDQDDYKNALAVLFSSRAICEMKNGRSRECIHDCNKSIQFTPTVKAFLRRAAALETIENFLSAYSDYQASLKLDSTNATALQGLSRLSSVLKAEHGSSWREKLPGQSTIFSSHQLFPTPASTSSNHTPNVENKEKTSTPENTCSESTSIKQAPVAENKKKSVEEQFKDTKNMGNKCVQQGKYSEAVPYYTTCIKLLPNEVPSYTNRALCFLKMNEPSKAIEDCEKALSFQPQNIKAIFRKAQANKMLKQYKEALSDLSLLLKYEPNNTMAKKERDDCKKLFRQELLEIQATNEASKLKTNSKSKKMKIDEVSSEKDSTSSKTTKLSTKAAKCPTAKINQSKWQSTKKMTGFEFLQEWNGIKSGKLNEYAELLKQVEPQKLPELLSNKLDGDIIKTIIHTIHDHFSTKEWYKFGISLLKNVSRTPRFVMMLMFLSTSDKTLLKTTVDLLEVRVKQNGEKNLHTDINNIRTSYRCS